MKGFSDGFVMQMVNQIKIRLMAELAMYEEGRGRADLRLHRYKRADYLVVRLIRAFFFTTIGFALTAGLVVLGNLEYILNHLNSAMIRSIVAWTLIVYAAILLIYMIVELTRAIERHADAEEEIGEYLKKLRELQRM